MTGRLEALLCVFERAKSVGGYLLIVRDMIYCLGWGGRACLLI